MRRVLVALLVLLATPGTRAASEHRVKALKITVLTSQGDGAFSTTTFVDPVV